ncbi:MAG: O-antigen ligase family protein [Candidatus Krumholzibacteriia bacterium]
MPRTWEPNFVIYGMFLVFVLARYMQWGYRREIFAVTRFELLLGVILLCACVLIAATRPVQLRDGARLIYAILALYVVLAIQVPFAYDPPAAERGFTEGVVKHSFLTVFMLILIRSPRQYKLFVLTWLLACFYVYQESTRGLIGGGLYWQNQGIMRLHGAVPIYHHPNSLGAFAVDALPFVFYLFIPARKLLVRAWFVAILVLGAVCVVYSGSRSAYLALVGFVLFVWGMSKQKTKALLIGLLVLPVLVVLVPDQYVGRFESIGGDSTTGRSREARLALMEDAWQLFLQNPLGTGLEAFPKLRYDTYGANAQYTHNLYLEILVATGIQGLIVFSIFIFALVDALKRAKTRTEALIRTVRRSAARLPSGQHEFAGTLLNDLLLARGMVLGCLGFLVMHLLMGMFGHDLLYVYWWFLAGNAFVLLRVTRVLGRRVAILVNASEAANDLQPGNSTDGMAFRNTQTSSGAR